MVRRYAAAIHMFVDIKSFLEIPFIKVLLGVLRTIIRDPFSHYVQQMCSSICCIACMHNILLHDVEMTIFSSVLTTDLYHLVIVFRDVSYEKGVDFTYVENQLPMPKTSIESNGRGTTNAEKFPITLDSVYG